LEKLLVDNVITEDFELAKRGIEIIIPGKPRITPIKPVETPKQEEQKAPEPSDAKNQDSEEEEGEEEEQKPNGPTFATATAHKGTQIKADKFKFSGAGIVECTQLHLVILCQRCRSQIEVTVNAGATYAEECSKCHNALVVTYRKDAMHEASGVVGYLDITGCIPFDMLPSQFTVSCFECSANVPFKNVSITDIEVTQNCTNCHKKIAISIGSIRFIKIKAERAPPPDIVIPKKKKAKDPNMVGIKVGTPLPEYVVLYKGEICIGDTIATL
jgi:hypothetical protein